MAEISAMAFAPDNAPYNGLLVADRGQHLADPQNVEQSHFEDNVEPLLRIQEHLQGRDDPYAGVNAFTLDGDHGAAEPRRDARGHREGQAHGSRSAENGTPSTSPKFQADSVYVGDSGIDFGSGPYCQATYEQAQSHIMSSSIDDTFGKGLNSDPPYDLGYGLMAEEDGHFSQPTGVQRLSPGASSNLGLSNDEQVLGSATESLQSPDFQPYEYSKNEAGKDFGDYGLGAPRILPSNFSAQEYDDSRPPTFKGLHDGFHSDGDFSGVGLGHHMAKTPELNTWQHAALSAAYADATKAAALRALVEASFYPHSPDLYDSLGRSLTGGGNLDYHPVYGVYRNMPPSESPSSLLSTPNLALLLNSPTFEPPMRGASAGATKSRPSTSSRKTVAPEFETKVLPRPSFAASSGSGGSFMMVNLRVKKGGQKKKASGNNGGVSKRVPVGPKPRSLNEQTDMWQVGKSGN